MFGGEEEDLVVVSWLLLFVDGTSCVAEGGAGGGCEVEEKDAAFCGWCNDFRVREEEEDGMPPLFNGMPSNLILIKNGCKLLI